MNASLAPTFRPADYHRLLAVLDDGDTVQLGYHLDWPLAVDRWTELDDHRRAGRLPGVRYLMVRSVDDPKYLRVRVADSFEVVPLVVASDVHPATGRSIRNGYTTRERAARAFAAFTGAYQGSTGGWIYGVRLGTGVGGQRLVPIVQGWWKFGTILRNQGHLIQRDGRWYITASALKVGAPR